MRRTSILVSMLALSVFTLLATASADAHDTRPRTSCPAGTQVAVVGHFDFSEQQLIDYYLSQSGMAKQVLGSTCFNALTCGIIDEWYWANQLAHESALETLSTRQLRTTALSNTPTPIVRYPETFNLTSDTNPKNGIIDHHDQYRFAQGLSGDYLGCRAVISLPGGTTGRNR